jgi:hypothetical protein
LCEYVFLWDLWGKRMELKKEKKGPGRPLKNEREGHRVALQITVPKEVAGWLKKTGNASEWITNEVQKCIKEK